MIKWKLFSDLINSDFHVHRYKIVQILLLLYSVALLLLFFGFYQPYISISPITPIYETIIKSVIVGGILYLILSRIVKVLYFNTELNQRNTIFYLKNPLKYSLFILIILCLSTLFSSQSVLVVKNDEFSINNSQGTISPDFSKVAFIAQNNHGQYLYVKDLTKSYVNIYQLCSWTNNRENGWCPNSFPLKFYNDNTIFFYSINGTEKMFVLSYNLNQKKFTNDFQLPFYNQGLNSHNFVMINSTLFLLSIIWGFCQNGSCPLQLTNINTQQSLSVTMPIPQTNKTSLVVDSEEFMIDSSFNNLAVRFATRWGYGPRVQYIDFFKINNFKLELLQSFNASPSYGLFSTFHFLSWDSNNSVLNFSWYNSSYTKVESFNFENSTYKTVLEVQKGLDITDIDTTNSYLFSGPVTRIYSFTNSQVNLIQNTSFHTLFSDISLNKIVASDNSGSKTVLLSYQPKTNNLRRENTIAFYDHSFDSNLKILKIINILIESATMITFFIFLVTIIGTNSQWYKR